MQCKAFSRSSGKQCGNKAMIGREVCYMHGGKSPKAGAGHPGIKAGGRYSKSLPTRLAARYEEAMADPELLSLREDVALVEARIVELLGRLDAGESGRIWSQLMQAKSDLVAAQDTAERQLALNEMLRLIDRGNADWMAFTDIVQLLEQKRKLGESERKRQIEMRQVFTAEQGMLFIAFLTDLINRHVTDRAARALIAGELDRFAQSTPR